MKVNNIFAFLETIVQRSSKELGGKEVVICVGSGEDAFIVSSHKHSEKLTPERKDIFCGMSSVLAVHFLMEDPK